MTEPHDILLVPAQFPTIQAAVDAVERPATIVVDPGAYDESVAVRDKGYLVIQSARFSRRGVTIAGANGGGVLSVERSTLHLSGIEIRSNGRLRGMWVSDSTVSLQDCVIAGNHLSTYPRDPDGFGAGMFCRSSKVRVQKSTIVGNTVDCTHVGTRDTGQVSGSPSVSESRTTKEARGGGLYLDRCTVEIAGSTIQANAVYSSGPAGGGGIWCEASRMRMWRSRVTDNALRSANSEGAGIYLKDMLASELGGSVITGNGSAQGRGGGIFIYGDSSAISIHRNTVVRQNHPDDIFAEHNSAPRK